MRSLTLWGAVPGMVSIVWLLVVPFHTQTQFPPVISGSCGPAVAAVFRSPAGDELVGRCGEAADGRFVSAGIVAVSLVVWSLLRRRMGVESGYRAPLTLWIFLAGCALFFAPFTVKGDAYENDGGSVWYERVECPPAWASLRYANVDGSRRRCAVPGAVPGFLGLAMATTTALPLVRQLRRGLRATGATDPA